MVAINNGCTTTRGRKQAHACLELKSIDGQGRFAGYASIFDVVDNQQDIMLPGAFSNTLRKQSGNVKLLWQHRQTEPVGVINELFEDTHGLYIEGQLLLDVSKAKEALILLRAGAVKGLSIGYSPVRYRLDPDTGVRLLAEVELWEVSLVTFPANSAAQVTIVKQHAGETHTKQLSACDGVALSDALDRAVAVLNL